MCLCFTEQAGQAGENFRKLHLSLTKHVKFAYIVAQVPPKEP
jgi:hypothetical protein